MDKDLADKIRSKPTEGRIMETVKQCTCDSKSSCTDPCDRDTNTVRLAIEDAKSLPPSSRHLTLEWVLDRAAQLARKTKLPLREEFEAQAPNMDILQRGPGRWVNLEKDPLGSYKDDEVEMVWQGFKAGRKES